MIDVRTWLKTSCKKLSQSNQVDPDENHLLISEMILSSVLGTSRVWIKTYPEYLLTEEIITQADLFLHRASCGEPLAYILGKQEFFGLEFEVTPDVLIPRPETELIVDNGLRYINQWKGHLLGLDIGTGSGCIAISLCANSPNLTCIATDISYKALRIAQKNCQRHHLIDRIHLVQSDLFPPTREKFNLICANLPYIPSEDLASLKVNRYEPLLALNGSHNGIEIIRRMLSQVKDYLFDKFVILIEIQYNQAQLIAPIIDRLFPQSALQILSDLNGHPRIIRIES